MRPGDELLLFAVKDGQEEPHGNRRSWPVSRVVRVVNEVGDPTHAAICVGPFEGPSMTYSEVRRVVHAEGEEFYASGPLTTRAAATVLRALVETEGRTAEVEVDALRERPISCPRCEARLRLVLRGMPPGPPDPDVYVMGGCALPAGPVATHACLACGWEGRRRDWYPEQVREIASLDDLFRHLGADDLESLADKVTDDLDHDPVGLDVHADADGYEVGVEANLGGTGVVLDFPFTTVDFWDTWDGLHDGWQLRTGERESGLDEA
ncbi:MAG: hypothetical protein K0R97_1135 [Oerskovia sp.]|nr:hypothetical protein [Oerskovia sp.]